MKISTSEAKLSKSSAAERISFPFETRLQNSSTLIPNMTATER